MTRPLCEGDTIPVTKDPHYDELGHEHAEPPEDREPHVTCTEDPNWTHEINTETVNRGWATY